MYFLQQLSYYILKYSDFKSRIQDMDKKARYFYRNKKA